VLGGIPGRIPSDRLFDPHLGLRISRYPRGDAFTVTLTGQEFHLHETEVIKERPASSLFTRRLFPNSLSPDLSSPELPVVTERFQGNGSHVQWMFGARCKRMLISVSIHMLLSGHVLNTFFIFLVPKIVIVLNKTLLCALHRI
jgi:hypothetical protein